MKIKQWDINFYINKKKWWSIHWFRWNYTLTRTIFISIFFFQVCIRKHYGPRNLGNIPYIEWPDWIKRLNIR